MKPRDFGSLTQWQLIRLRFNRHQLAVISVGVIVTLYLVAIFAEFIAPYGSHQTNLAHTFAPPQVLHFNFHDGLHTYAMQKSVDPLTLDSRYIEDDHQIVHLKLFGRTEPYRLWGLIPLQHRLLAVRDGTCFLLGADRYGRCILSRLIFGARISLSIGLVAIAVSFVLGLTIGGISGYVGGTTDLVIQRLIEVLQAIPGLPLWITFGAILPADWPPLWVYFGITLVLSFLGWTGLARTVRSKLLQLREEDYAVAARLLGASHGRIIFRHLLPGFTSHIIVSLSLTVPAMILGETALSFLGLGLRPPLVSWGVMMQDCLNLESLARHPWLIMPTVLVALAVMAFNFAGDGLRDAADPYSTR